MLVRSVCWLDVLSCFRLGDDVRKRATKQEHMMCWHTQEGLCGGGRGLGLRNILDSDQLLEVNIVNISL